MTNLTKLDPKSLSKGDICYYANGCAVEFQQLHLFQVTRVVAVKNQFITLDNGCKFNLESGEEVTKSAKGQLYPYSHETIKMVTEAQQKLSLINEVQAIDFSSLTVQQLSMIKDVSRGAFTQVTAPSPCGGGCGGRPVTYHDDSTPDIATSIGLNDATYELDDSELDDIEATDEDDDYIEVITA